MANIKQNFSIKDLESLSGIKAHTIRMWEKRYKVLEPKRTDTNIRTYGVSGLQKILNIAFLNENGYKISRISKMTDNEISELVKRITTSKSNYNRAVKSLKVAMMNFDQSLFLKTYDGLLEHNTFREIYNDVFIPLLTDIGMLWQAGTITPAHEQFISTLIKQKLFINIEKLQFEKPSKTDKVFVLFLPEEEIHDVGLFYTNYELLLHGYKVIFLGQSLPMEDLTYLSKLFDNTVFVSYLTIKPKNIDEYLERFTESICTGDKCEYWLLGRKAIEIIENDYTLPKRVRAFKNINELTLNL
ncbi:MerR family transcriptional regulator [Mesohalobacter halotolerans]|uniref:MerR family transcriptional regulator n=1 Tax=Mesohalobacter halotolerans TaxID=1883405 RepID=A0A4V6ALI0_9FLAO|nr:MerR family transcriptional regulator [Mesohalobacter halotolerans]MBS3738718.1 MerR family transcriptional regulator [Psychroflexus sp.]TKS56725.1 MerR family transcriptional regulator [Mesohalobacter halotolerans]